MEKGNGSREGWKVHEGKGIGDMVKRGKEVKGEHEEGRNYRSPVIKNWASRR